MTHSTYTELLRTYATQHNAIGHTEANPRFAMINLSRDPRLQSAYNIRELQSVIGVGTTGPVLAALTPFVALDTAHGHTTELEKWYAGFIVLETYDHQETETEKRHRLDALLTIARQFVRRLYRETFDDETRDPTKPYHLVPTETDYLVVDHADNKRFLGGIRCNITFKSYLHPEYQYDASAWNI